MPTTVADFGERPLCGLRLQHSDSVTNGSYGPVVTDAAPCTYLH
jgi:hypothetical protein